MRTLFASAALVATAATVAIASPTYAKAAPSTDAASDSVVLTQAHNGKFCTAPAVVTGSIMLQRVCKTRAEWLAAGAHETSRS